MLFVMRRSRRWSQPSCRVVIALFPLSDEDFSSLHKSLLLVDSKCSVVRRFRSRDPFWLELELQAFFGLFHLVATKKFSLLSPFDTGLATSSIFVQCCFCSFPKSLMVSGGRVEEGEALREFFLLWRRRQTEGRRKCQSSSAEGQSEGGRPKTNGRLSMSVPKTKKK
jgi:hypothetical protein